MSVENFGSCYRLRRALFSSEMIFQSHRDTSHPMALLSKINERMWEAQIGTFFCFF